MNDHLKPPTDNLYKFMAIGGLAAVIAASYFYFTWLDRTNDDLLRYHNEVADIINEYHSSFMMLDGSPIAEPNDDNENGVLDSIQFTTMVEDEKERMEVLKHLAMHDSNLVKFARFPVPSDQNARDFWKASCGLSDSQFDEMTERKPFESPSPDNFITRTNKLAKDFRPRHQRIIYTMDMIWGIDDDTKLLKRGLIAVVIIGTLAAVTGFTLWYFKVQRYQDRILRIEFENARLERQTHSAPQEATVSPSSTTSPEHKPETLPLAS